MNLYDSHNHLQDELLVDCRTACLTILNQIGLKGAVVNGTMEDDWEKVFKLSRKVSWVWPSYGLHPWYVSGRSENWVEKLEKRLEGGGFVGEIGLDCWKQPVDLHDQKGVFETQLSIAVERNLPVTIHCLKAWDVLIQILRSHNVPAKGFLLHAYGGPEQMISEFVELGAYFSFNGYFLHARKAERLQIFRRIPMERLLIETDSPAMPLPAEHERYLLPDSPNGTRVNHPANIIAAYDGLSIALEMEKDRLSRQVEENFERLFGVLGLPAQNC